MLAVVFALLSPELRAVFQLYSLAFGQIGILAILFVTGISWVLAWLAVAEIIDRLASKNPAGESLPF